MKIAKRISNVIFGALTIYLGVFVVWLMLAMSCIQYEDQHNAAGQYCGSDTLTQIIRVTHAPLLALFIDHQ